MTSWLSFSGPSVKIQEDVPKMKDLLHKDIPVLDDYSKKPLHTYWTNFPFKELPEKPCTKINTEKLAYLLNKRRHLMTMCEWERGVKALKYLQEGAPSHQMVDLPAIACENSASATEYGAILSDTIATWIEEGFVAGPFIFPPLKKFRVNPLKMVPQHNKVRPVLNVSAPVGSSFNDKVSKTGPERLTMSSAKKFGQSLLKAGVNAIMSKFDMRNAYKIVPCNMADLRLQGFKWCGRFFVETTQPFGAITAVSNYDIVGNTVCTLAKCVSSIPNELVHRQIDDVPAVAPMNTSWCEEFTKEYSGICEALNIELAPDCPLKDKAFKLSKEGKVLGIMFDSSTLSWSLPSEKRTEYMNDIHEVLIENCVSLEKAQSILGKLNFVSTMAPMMRTFKKPFQELVCTLIESESISLPLPEEVRSDLLIWWSYLRDNGDGMPLVEELGAPPLYHKVITTDAAGWKKDSFSNSKVGLGCIGLGEEGDIIFASQHFWNSDRSRTFVDSEGKFLGCKTTTLEFAGILVPFLSYPELLTDQTVVVQVDNIGCHFAWKNGYARSDNMASILVRTLVLLSEFLNCKVIVNHHPRESSWEIKLADRLSRESSTTSQDRKLVQSFQRRNLPSVFSVWMENPSEDWDLPKKIMSVMSR